MNRKGCRNILSLKRTLRKKTLFKALSISNQRKYWGNPFRKHKGNGTRPESWIIAETSSGPPQIKLSNLMKFAGSFWYFCLSDQGRDKVLVVSWKKSPMNKRNLSAQLLTHSLLLELFLLFGKIQTSQQSQRPSFLQLKVISDLYL